MEVKCHQFYSLVLRQVLAAQRQSCFTKKGWVVGLADLDIVGLEQVQKAMDKQRSCVLVMNVTDSESVKNAFIEFNTFNVKSLNVLSDCACILRMGNNETISLPDQHKILHVNISGILNLYAICGIKLF